MSESNDNILEPTLTDAIVKIGLPGHQAATAGAKDEPSSPSQQSAVGRTSLFEVSKDELEAWVGGLGQPSYRASQILDWVHRRGVVSFGLMSNLPATLRSALDDRFRLFNSTIVQDRTSADGARKLLLAWADGRTTECVLIPDGDRRTACVSTQVGCPVQCAFCASGLNGLERQLSAGEIVEQAYRLAWLDDPQVGGLKTSSGVERHLGEETNLVGSSPKRGLTNVVFMGLGEPLSNYKATLEAVRRLNAPWGMGIGARKITISTVGLPVAMRRLADEGLQVTLALSLHAPNDELRRRIIPWAEYATIDELFAAADHYFQKTGREITIEYILLGGVNDAPSHATELARIARRIRANVNLIAYNEVAGLPFIRPKSTVVASFQAVLRGAGVNVHVRRSRGRDIEAACGQLRRDWKNENKEKGLAGRGGKIVVDKTC